MNNTLAFDQNAMTCVFCHQVLNFCIQCTSSACTRCNDGFQLYQGKCVCSLGTLAAGVCTEIVGCTQPAKLPDGSEICLVCNSTLFDTDPVNGICKCSSGTLLNGICNTIPNCITPKQLPNGQIECLFCNIANNYRGHPDASGQCICKDKYERVNDACL